MDTKWKYDTEVGCLNGNVFWYFSMQFNGLFCIDLETHQKKFLGSVPYEELYQERLYGSIQYFNEKIYLVPFSANYFSIYDLKEKTFNKLNIEAPKRYVEFYNSKYKWQNSILVDDRLYMFGLTHSAIVKMDLNTLKTEYIYDWIDEYEKTELLVEDDLPAFFFEKYMAFDGNMIMIPIGVSNMIMSYDVRKDIYEFWKLGENEDRFYNIAKIKNNICLIHKNSKKGILVYDRERKKTRSLKIEGCEDLYAGINLISWKDKLLIIPSNGLGGGFYDFENDLYEKIPSLNNIKGVYHYLIQNDSLILYLPYEGRVIRYFSDLSIVNECDLLINDDIYKLLVGRVLNLLKEEIVRETDEINLSKYLAAITYYKS